MILGSAHTLLITAERSSITVVAILCKLVVVVVVLALVLIVEMKKGFLINNENTNNNGVIINNENTNNNVNHNRDHNHNQSIVKYDGNDAQMILLERLYDELFITTNNNNNNNNHKIYDKCEAIFIHIIGIGLILDFITIVDTVAFLSTSKKVY